MNIRSIKNPPELIQFAKDGKYEEAWIIRLDESRPSESVIKEYLDKDIYEKLIVEFIWNNELDEERYVLTVVQNEGCEEKDGYGFIVKCFDIFYEKLEFSELVTRIDQEIIGGEFLLKNPVQKVRLGVFNNWFSLGPIDIWSVGEDLDLDLEVISQKIKERPEIERSKLNYQGLAFIYNYDGSLPGPYHVLKTPCCHKVNDEWVVDIELVEKYLREMIK